MTSCESSRNSACVYSNDIRWRLIWQTALRLPTRQVASNLSVDETTVRRVVRHFEATGSVDKKTYPSERSFRKISNPAQLFILHLVVDRPGIYLREIKNELQLQLGIDVSEGAIIMFFSIRPVLLDKGLNSMLLNKMNIYTHYLLQMCPFIVQRC